MAVPIVIFVVGLGAGVFAGTRWLPELARGPVGGLAFFVVCGIVGAIVGDAGLRIYDTVRTIEGTNGQLRQTLVSEDLAAMLYEVGALAALGMIVFLLAPGSRSLQESKPD